MRVTMCNRCKKELPDEREVIDVSVRRHDPKLEAEALEKGKKLDIWEMGARWSGDFCFQCFEVVFGEAMLAHLAKEK